MKNPQEMKIIKAVRLTIEESSGTAPVVLLAQFVDEVL